MAGGAGSIALACARALSIIAVGRRATSLPTAWLASLRNSGEETQSRSYNFAASLFIIQGR